MIAEDAAVAAAERRRAGLPAAATLPLAGVAKRYIEVRRGAEPPEVRDLLVWVVRYARAPVWFEFAVDATTGEVVRVRRSRGGAG